MIAAGHSKNQRRLRNTRRLWCIGAATVGYLAALTGVKMNPNEIIATKLYGFELAGNGYYWDSEQTSCPDGRAGCLVLHYAKVPRRVPDYDPFALLARLRGEGVGTLCEGRNDNWLVTLQLEERSWTTAGLPFGECVVTAAANLLQSSEWDALQAKKPKGILSLDSFVKTYMES